MKEICQFWHISFFITDIRNLNLSLINQYTRKLKRLTGLPTPTYSLRPNHLPVLNCDGYKRGEYVELVRSFIVFLKVNELFVQLLYN